MSLSLNYRFRDALTLNELATSINDCLGCSLDRQSDVYFVRCLGFETFLTQAYRNKDDCRRDNEYSFSFKTAAGNAGSRPAMLPAILLAIIELHKGMKITGALVYDGHHHIVDYDERNGVLFNATCNEIVDDFGVELERLVATLPKGHWL